MQNGREEDEKMTVLGEQARAIGRYFDGRADTYEEKMSRPYFRLLREITWQHIRRFLPRQRGARVLDAGGATGYWSMRLARAGYRVVLVDVSEEMLAVAQAKINEAGLGGEIEVVLGDVTDLRDFSEGSFDATLALEEPLSFCGDPEMAVAEMALVTKRDSIIAATVLNRFRSREHEKYLKKGDVEGLERYLRSGTTDGREISRKSFSAEEVEALFISNGLEVASAIGKPLFAEAAGGRLEDKAVFSKILEMELGHNANRSLWGTAETLEFVAIKA